MLSWSGLWEWGREVVPEGELPIDMLSSIDLVKYKSIWKILVKIQTSSTLDWSKSSTFLEYLIPEIPDDSGKILGMDWVGTKISGSGRVLGTRWARSLRTWTQKSNVFGVSQVRLVWILIITLSKSCYSINNSPSCYSWYSCTRGIPVLVVLL